MTHQKSGLEGTFLKLKHLTIFLRVMLYSVHFKFFFCNWFKELVRRKCSCSQWFFDTFKSGSINKLFKSLNRDFSISFSEDFGILEKDLTVFENLFVTFLLFFALTIFLFCKKKKKTSKNVKKLFKNSSKYNKCSIRK